MNQYKTKHPLRFSDSGSFRVLMLSDIQESASYDERSLKSVCALLDSAKPDLVILGGDNCYGPEINSFDDLKAFLEVFTAPMEERKIPWAHVFGNHDHDVPCDIEKQQQLYEAYPMCVSSHTDSSVHGKSNFVLPIYDRHGKDVVFNVWGMDTNNLAEELDALVPSGDMQKSAQLPKNTLGIGRWSTIYFDQLMWYYNTSCDIENKCGKKILGMLCMHIAPQEFTMAAANPDICVKNGNYGEMLDSGCVNSGIFSLILQRGDIKTISCGHTHMNDFEAEYCGVRMCWDACAGYRCYGTDEIRGGRLFEISEADPWNIKTSMIHTLDMING